MIRSGWVPAQTSRCQQFQARVQASPSSWSSAREKTDPQNPATRDGKQREAQIPPMSMSRHPGVDVVAPRSHLVEAGRLHAPLLPRPADHRVEADVRVLAAFE